MKILDVVGARPNFMKAAPLVRVLRERGEHTLLIHTGQHYDAAMSKVFFEDLSMPEPDAFLGVGSGTHAEQTGRVMTAIERVLQDERPDLVVVFGDVNSTLATALVAAKLHVPLAHVEAGLRSRDRTMPEEINRIVTDQLSELLLTPSRDADENLLAEGVAKEKIFFVGNIMIDSLVAGLARAEASDVLERLGLEPRAYAVLTLHRPANVDDVDTLLGLMAAIHRVSEELPIVFPCHPRTAARLDDCAAYRELTSTGDVRRIEPLGYLDFLRLTSQSRLVLTDSGGLQEETTYLGIPCVTIRENTERPITITQGTNVLAGTDPVRVEQCARAALEREPGSVRPPDLWDGHTAERIADVFAAWGRERGLG